MSVEAVKHKLVYDTCIRVYTDEKNIPSEYTKVQNHNLYFDTVTINRIGPKDFETMQLYSYVTEFSNDTREIVTLYGNGEIKLTKLYIRCKALLNVRNTQDNEKIAFEITSIDAEIVEKMFEYVDKHNISVIFYGDIWCVSNMHFGKGKAMKCILNDKKVCLLGDKN